MTKSGENVGLEHSLDINLVNQIWNVKYFKTMQEPRQDWPLNMRVAVEIISFILVTGTQIPASKSETSHMIQDVLKKGQHQTHKRGSIQQISV